LSLDFCLFLRKIRPQKVRFDVLGLKRHYFLLLFNFTDADVELLQFILLYNCAFGLENAIDPIGNKRMIGGTN
jgi:hypothetical protein